ncbi:MAG: DUF3298 domain-containing protein [Acetatifactor sp.]|nr:DUF3298 domain-containing protein [Acetatifactor sp.]
MDMHRNKFWNKKAVSGLVIAAGMAVITGCGMETAVTSGVSRVEEAVPRGDSVEAVYFYRAHGQRNALMPIAGRGDALMSVAAGDGIRLSATAAGDAAMLAANTASQTEQSTDSVMGSVPYFRDDAGKRIQMVDGYLYGYWNNRLCRYDPETLEETVLYEAASPQNGDFCVWGDYVYFMVVPNVSAVGKLHGYLYRVKCDGSEEAVCLTSVVMPDQDHGGQYYQYYKLDTYEDVLYLLRQRDDDENRYFRLNRDGSIERIAESETLYGQLPEGDFSRWRYDPMLTLPYAMRNYGYAFMSDDKDNPVRIDLDSQQVERIDILNDHVVRTVTNDAIIVSKNNVWYRLSLDDTDEVREIGTSSGDYVNLASWDEKGLYFTSTSGDESIRLSFMDWEGEEETLQYGLISKQYPLMEYFDDDYYYYVAESRGNDVVRRWKLTGDEDTEAEEVAVYREDPYYEVIIEESFDYGWTDARADAGIEYSITQVFLKEDTGAFGKINDYMDNLYAQDIGMVENFRKTVREMEEEYLEDWGPDRLEASDTYDLFYMDENYVGIVDIWYQYQWGAAHGMHGCIYYMFDRNTGERVSVTDVVNSSPEEICEIIAPYVESIAAWGTDEEGWETTILDEGRFFLSEEGIGIHFDTYEIDCYAAGDQTVIVPYGMFDLRGQ